jgi:selenocysteine lyase/cysteine desulfurase
MSINHIGQDEIEARDRYLANYLIRKLKTIDGLKVYTSEDPKLSCGIVSFTIKDLSPAELNSELWEKHNIWIRSVSQQGVDWNVNRASLHLMVTTRDVNHLVGAIKELAAG